MLEKKFRGSFIEVRGEDGSLIKIRASQVNLIQLPASHLAIKPGQTPNALVLLGNTQMHFPVIIGETISQFLDMADSEAGKPEEKATRSIIDFPDSSRN